ncbi:MAG: bifunctional diguanylate cyclase/phosphodiesterase [Dactylosporangium sp.]|nr:bifunctional diguanylate cyclase/phosphodiesterase [Dactylosporangium sp.]NNJ63375.1 bifunctional diguanylate cyclase/phosphodiesterase [Dactylosporangium sp.]
MGRIALGGLALGLIALGGLTIWATIKTHTSTARVEAFNEINAQWNTVFVRLGAEDVALREFLTTNGSEYGRDPLIMTMGSAEPNLLWLEKHGGLVEADHVRMLRLEYKKYTDVVQAILDTAENRGDLSIYEELAALDLSQLRDQVVANVERKQRELALYLTEVEQRNASLGLMAIGIVVVDLSFCAMSTAILAMYQRLTERAVATSRHQALHDPLTGLANRHLLAEHTARAVGEARRREGIVSLLLIDLDRFKRVNDTLGHHCGDALLQWVAGRMAMTSRECDVVARIGGDEFAILLSTVDTPEDVPTIAERVRSAIEEPVELDGCWVDVGASIGASIFPIDCDNSEEILRHADAAMYIAKRGHLGVNVYTADSERNNPKVLPLLYELRREIECGGLMVHYQPRIDIRTMHVEGVEALVRWLHPSRGLLLPETFLPLIENSELIERLTEMVLQSAAKQVREWLAAGRRVPVGVNIAGRSLLDPGFPAMVAATIERFDMPAQLLTLELSETVLTAKPEATARAVLQLRELGVRISIDGFGIGYSSMALLRDLPVHEVKLGRNLITRAVFDERDRAVTRAPLDLARNLDLDLVAVGVEDEETLALLSELGCHVVQGYHVSKPLPPAELSVWLDDQSAATPTVSISR